MGAPVGLNNQNSIEKSFISIACLAMRSQAGKMAQRQRVHQTRKKTRIQILRTQVKFPVSVATHSDPISQWEAGDSLTKLSSKTVYIIKL